MKELLTRQLSGIMRSDQQKLAFIDGIHCGGGGEVFILASAENELLNKSVQREAIHNPGDLQTIAPYSTLQEQAKAQKTGRVSKWL